MLLLQVNAQGVKARLGTFGRLFPVVRLRRIGLVLGGMLISAAFLEFAGFYSNCLFSDLLLTGTIQRRKWRWSLIFALVSPLVLDPFSNTT